MNGLNDELPRLTPEQKIVYDKVMQVITDCMDKFVKEKVMCGPETAACMSDYINRQLQEQASELGLKAPEDLQFKLKGETMIPADRYTAFVSYCAMNEQPLPNNLTRETCPEELVLFDGSRLTYKDDKGTLVIQVVKPLEYIEIKFAVDAYGDVKSKIIDKDYKVEDA